MCYKSHQDNRHEMNDGKENRLLYLIRIINKSVIAEKSLGCRFVVVAPAQLDVTTSVVVFPWFVTTRCTVFARAFGLFASDFLLSCLPVNDRDK